uniref:Uncharacterized protein n=1 Tax=Rhizophora mucronata TaxID=61149 RepID=A0A2P2ND55_RHIMU
MQWLIYIFYPAFIPSFYLFEITLFPHVNHAVELV